MRRHPDKKEPHSQHRKQDRRRRPLADSATEDQVDLDYAGSVTEGQPDSNDTSYRAKFGDWAKLLSAQVETENRATELTLRWLALATPTNDFTVFVHIYDREGKVRAQRDGYLVGRTLPMNKLKPGDLVEDVRTILLPMDLAPGRYAVVVGTYDRQGGLRAPALAPDGKRFDGDAVWLGDVEIAQ